MADVMQSAQALHGLAVVGVGAVFLELLVLRR